MQLPREWEIEFWGDKTNTVYMVAHELIINYSIALTISERKQNEKDKNARYHGKGQREVGRTEGRPVR